MLGGPSQLRNTMKNVIGKKIVLKNPGLFMWGPVRCSGSSDAPRPFENGGLLAPLSRPPCPSQSPAELDAWLGARAGFASPSLFTGRDSSTRVVKDSICIRSLTPPVTSNERERLRSVRTRRGLRSLCVFTRTHFKSSCPFPEWI